MIGSRQMERVLSAAQAVGTKVVLIGDPEQLQAIEAGRGVPGAGGAAWRGGDHDRAPAARAVAAGRHARAGHGAHGAGAGAVCGGGHGVGG